MNTMIIGEYHSEDSSCGVYDSGDNNDGYDSDNNSDDDSYAGKK